MIRPASRLAAQIVTTTITLVAILFAVAALLLARGPISLAFLTPYLLTALNDESAAVQIAFDNTVLVWVSRTKRVETRVLGVRVLRADGEILATVPQMSLDLKGLALLEGRLEPVNLTLLAPTVRLVRDIQGNIDLGMGAEASAGGELEDGLVAAWTRGDLPEFTRSLVRVSIVDAELTIEDRLTGAVRRVPNSNLAMSRDTRGIVLELMAKLEVAGRPAGIEIDALYPGQDQPVRVRLGLSDVEPAALIRELSLEALKPLEAVRAPVSGTIVAEWDGNRRLGRIGFEVSAGPGAVHLPGLYDKPVEIAGMTASGQIDETHKHLALEDLFVDLGGGLTAQFVGGVQRGDGGIGVSGEGTVRNLKADDFDRYWPEAFATSGRRWMIKRVHSGRVNEARVAVDIKPGELTHGKTRPEMVVVTFGFEGVAARYWDALPEATDGRGSGRIDASDIVIEITEGRIGALQISEGRLEIRQFQRKGQVADIAFVARGPTEAALTLLDRKPLRFAARLGIDPATTAGQSATRARLLIPLKRKLDLKEIGYAAAATLSEFVLPDAFGLYRLTDGALSLAVARDGLDGSGTVALNGVPVSLTWRRDFDPGDNLYPSRYGLAAVLDDAGRQALGLRLHRYLQGPAPVQLQLSTGEDGLLLGQGTADVRSASLAVPELLWTKPPGMPGRIDFAFKSGPTTPFQVERFEVVTDELDAAGAIEFDRNLQSRRLSMGHVRFNGNAFAAEVAFLPNGRTEAVLAGDRFDLRPFLESEPEGARTESEPGELTLRARLGELVLSDRLKLLGVEAEAERQGGRWHGITAQGALNGQVPVEIQIVPADAKHQRVTVTSDDAGAVSLAIGLFSGITGGRLRLLARVPAGPDARGPLVGRVIANDFRVVNAPTLTKMLSVGSVTGIRDLARGEGIAFRRLDAPFAMDDEIIAIGDARAVGPALGLTLSGKVDRLDQTADLKGTVVPAYTINSVLGNIPLLGKLLTGGEGEGVFAFTYTLRGPVEEPTVEVNPLSVLAPGYLRRIVAVLDQPDVIERVEDFDVVPRSPEATR